MKRTAPALLGAAVVAACSWYQTYYPAFPGLYATGVDPDVVIEIDFRTPLDPQLPALDRSFPLIGPDGIVEATYQVDGPVLTITPDEPLPDGRYEVFGSLDDIAAGANGHYTTPLLTDFPGDTLADLRFSVGGDPQVLGRVDGELGLLVYFSEPVRPRTIFGTIDGVTEQAEPAHATNIVVFEAFAGTSEPLTLEPGAISRRDVPIDLPDEVGWMDECDQLRIEGLGCF